MTLDEISEDMYSVPSETVYEANFVDVDTTTGEVIEDETNAM